MPNQFDTNNKFNLTLFGIYFLYHPAISYWLHIPIFPAVQGIENKNPK